MNITRTDAIVILESSGVCLFEGIGPDDADLVRRIFDAFPDLRARFMYLLPADERARVAADLAIELPRVITRVMDDGIKTKDGAA